jgi:V/A-type H+-transporting ATPase subunit I
MAVSRMLKIQLIAHASIREEIKSFLREAGVLEVTDVSVEGFRAKEEEAEVVRLTATIERTDSAIQFLERYVAKPSFFERLSLGPVPVTSTDITATSREVDIEDISKRCGELESAGRRCRDELAWSNDLARELEPWKSIAIPLDALATPRLMVQFWAFAEKGFDETRQRLEADHPLAIFDEVSRSSGRVRVAVIVVRSEADRLADALKGEGGIRSNFENLAGTPAAIIEREVGHRAELEAEIEKTEEEARELARVRPKLLVLSDHFHERKGLLEVERHVHNTDRTFIVEGWIRDLDRRKLEKEMSKRFSEVELLARPPEEGEDPPVQLENRPAIQPFEFIMTLYGRPLYNEIDPTPLIAPFFLLCFSVCMSDAGYGLVLGALSALVLFKFKIAGGLRRLFKVFLFGSVLTVVVGILTGGYFGIEVKLIPPAIANLMLINPLEEPMKMLNFTFFIGFVHILFGIGVRMAANFRAHLWTNAVFDDLCWILFLLALGPLGYANVLGEKVPGIVLFYCGRAALGLAALLFVTGARKERNKFLGAFKSLIKFYSITGYFSDVLSYARLLALGLAAAAIAVAINGIAQMVTGLPFYTGYVAAVVILVLGHSFNLAVNILGAFVHSARLQYLEFFNKFFTGGGREFRPFRNERRYTVWKETEMGT